MPTISPVLRVALAALPCAAGATAQTLQVDDVLLLRHVCSTQAIPSAVDAYRPSTGQPVFVGQGGTLKCWEGVAVLPNGQFAVSRMAPSGVNLFDTSGQQVATFDVPSVAYATDIAAFSDGTLAVVDLAGAHAERVTTNGQSLVSYSHPTLLSPWGAFVDGADVLWIADRVSTSLGSGALVRFDADGTWLGTTTLPEQCVDLVVAPDGTVWTIGELSNRAYHLQADGTLIQSFAVFPPGGYGYGIARLTDGSLVFSSSAHPDLRRYDENGNLLGLIPVAPSFETPFRLAAYVEPTWHPAGDGLAGVTGVPKLTGLGSLTAGSATEFHLSNAAPSTPAVLVVGKQRVDLPLFGGTLVPSPDVFVKPLPIHGNGTVTLGAVWPAGVPAGTKLWFQAWIPDALAVQGYAASNGLEATAP